jgi:hypothetical protein
MPEPEPTTHDHRGSHASVLDHLAAIDRHGPLVPRPTGTDETRENGVWRRHDRRLGNWCAAHLVVNRALRGRAHAKTSQTVD